MLERPPALLDEQALLRIHPARFARRAVEEQRIELVGVVDEAGLKDTLAIQARRKAERVLGLKLPDIYRGIVPFVFLYLIALGLITYVPWISMVGVEVFLRR